MRLGQGLRPGVEMRVLYPTPEDIWMKFADYCGFHLGVMVFEGRISWNRRTRVLDNLPQGEILAGHAE